MKKLIIAALTSLSVIGSTYAQGTVTFNTQSVGVTAKVTDTAEFFAANPNASGSTNVNGAGYYAQLFAFDGSGQAESSLLPVGNVVTNIRL